MNNMEHYTYKVNNNVELKIYYPNELGQYRVEHKDEAIGYIYVSAFDNQTNETIWLGSTEELSLIAGQIGEYLEKIDL